MGQMTEDRDQVPAHPPQFHTVHTTGSSFSYSHMNACIFSQTLEPCLLVENPPEGTRLHMVQQESLHLFHLMQ